MTVAATLLAYAVVVAVMAPKVLVRARWVRGVPRLGVIAWQASVFAVLGATVLLALTAVVPVERVSFDLSHLLHACATQLSQSYAIDDGAVVQAASLSLAAATLVRLLWALVAQLRRMRRERSRQRLFIDLLAEAGPDGEYVVDSDVPLAYCVPGGGGRIVLTRGAIAVLSSEQRVAVLAHERAHLDGRHDIVLLGADVAGVAFGFLGFFRTARHQLRGLVEMLADDAAARCSGELPVASALAGLGSQECPPGTFGAMSQLTAERIGRLVHRAPSLPVAQQLALGVSALSLALLPWAIAVAPAWSARNGLCLPPR